MTLKNIINEGIKPHELAGLSESQWLTIYEKVNGLREIIKPKKR